MRNLNAKLQLIREGYLFEGTTLDIESERLQIINHLREDASNIASTSYLLIEAGGFMGGCDIKTTFENIKRRIITMVTNFIQRLKIFFTNIIKFILRKYSKQTANPAAEARPEDMEQSMPEEPVITTKQPNPPKTKPVVNEPKIADITVMIPANLLSPRNGFNINIFRNLFDEVAMISENADGKMDILTAEDRRSSGIRNMLIRKLFGSTVTAKLNTPEEYMTFIYGARKQIKLSSIDKDMVIKELQGVEHDISILEDYAHRVRQLLASVTPENYLAGNKVSIVVEYRIKLFTEFGTLTNNLLSLYVLRCSELTKLLNTIADTIGNGG